MIELNAGQTAAVDGIVSGILEQGAPGFTIIGEGGTGKTTCIMFAAQRFLDAGLKVLFTAPTNKAVKQLEMSARSFGLNTSNVAFQTLHSALGLALLPNEENKWAVQVGEGVLEVFDVVVADEASMLSRILLNNHLLPRVSSVEGGKKVHLIFMGDDMQLPPVREEKSLAFEIYPTYRLTEVERQSEGSEILTVTGVLRTAIESDKPFKHPETEGREVTVVQAAKFIDTVLEAFDENTDLDGQRVLAWTNRRVDEINSRIRRKLYGKNAELFEVGERVVTGAPIREENELILATGEECIVEATRDSHVTDEETGEEYATLLLVLRPLHSDRGQVFAHVLKEEERERYDARLKSLVAKAKNAGHRAREYWAKYHQFKELFDTIKYAYCMTVHQSQGSTYDTVFVDVKNLLDNRVRRERQRLLYVAFSRPRKRLVINRKGYVA